MARRGIKKQFWFNKEATMLDKMISIRKRGNVYQYCFDAGKVNGKRKQITKSGFKTKMMHT